MVKIIHPRAPLRLSAPPCLLVIFVTLLSLAPTTAPSALAGLQSRLNSLHDVETLHARFICEKHLAMLESPLVSSGELWIKKGQNNEPGSVRFSTETPYVSELILSGGKVHARSQHEDKWTTTNQSTRPGLTAVMAQLGGWSTGSAGNLSDLYAITTAEKEGRIPPPPQVSATKAPPKSFDDQHSTLFVLTPTNKDLAVAVKSITLAMTEPAAKEPSKLIYIEITTAQDDQTRYWFYDGQINTQLPADIFQPVKGPATRGEQAP